MLLTETTVSSAPAVNPVLSSGDFSQVVQEKTERKLTDDEKYYLLTSHFCPTSTYQFPSVLHGSQKRSFQHSWLTKYNGLVYSELDQGGYCKYCVLFGKCPSSVRNFVSVLTTHPLTNLQKASEKLREHFVGIGSNSARKYHLAAIEEAESFKAVMEKSRLPVNQMLSRVHLQRITENRQNIISIVDTIIFCGRQGIALRGHRDDSKHLTQSSLANHGNFLALLRFRVDSGDKVLADHLSSSHQHQTALYTSKTIQNELIQLCGDSIRSIILNDVRAAGAFSIMADEATDAGNKEQLAICVRYVKKEAIEESFLGFSECVMSVTGEAIADCLLQHLTDWQLPASRLCGQSYDGAGAMAGKNKGAATRITQQYPKAVYTHWAAHVLNLCVVKCCSIPEVRNTMDIGDRICRFFAFSPKRQLAFERCVEEVLDGEKRRRLKSICKTRWVERNEAFEVFVDLFQPLVYCLENIKDSSEWNQDSRVDAQSFFLYLTRFPFIFALMVTKEVLGYTKALSVKLQGRYVDVVRAHEQIKLVKSTLTNARDNIDGFHSRVYAKALQVASKVQVQESIPRTTGRQQHRSNVPATSPSEYYRRSLTTPLLDYLSQKLMTGFLAS